MGSRYPFLGLAKRLTKYRRNAVFMYLLTSVYLYCFNQSIWFHWCVSPFSFPIVCVWSCSEWSHTVSVGAGRSNPIPTAPLDQSFHSVKSSASNSTSSTSASSEKSDPSTRRPHLGRQVLREPPGGLQRSTGPVSFSP